MGKRDGTKGAALREIRDDRGLKAKDVAAAAGVSGAYLSELETGGKPINERAILKLSKAFKMEVTAFQELLESRAQAIRSGSVSVSEHNLESARNSSALHRANASKRAHMQPSALDAEALLIHLVGGMTREQQFALLRELTIAAEKGDAVAFAKARALFDLIPPEVVAAGSSSDGRSPPVRK